MVRAIYSARSTQRASQYRFSAVRDSIRKFRSLFVQYPGVLGAATLARIDHQRAFLQRHARQPARHDGDMLAPRQHERPEIDMARREARRGAGRAGRQRQRWLGDKTFGLALELVAERLDRRLGGGG